MSVRAILGIILTLAFVLLIFFLAYQGKTETETFNLLVGALTGAALSHVLGYYFGTTESSQTKDDTINVQANAAAGNPVVPAEVASPKLVAQGP